MSDLKDRIETWEYMHNNKDLGALSGCHYEETIEALMINGMVSPNKYILEIGVGMGYVTKALYNHVDSLDVFDISKTALKRVRHYCNTTYSLSDIGELMPDNYDLIICQNVVQHIPTPLLYFELFHFIRSLSIDGVMAVKSISTEGYDDTGDDTNLVVDGTRCSNSIGCFCRSVDCFKTIVDRCGGVATLMTSKPCDVMFINEEQIYHITKKKYD